MSNMSFMIELDWDGQPLSCDYLGEKVYAVELEREDDDNDRVFIRWSSEKILTFMSTVLSDESRIFSARIGYGVSSTWMYLTYSNQPSKPKDSLIIVKNSSEGNIETLGRFREDMSINISFVTREELTGGNID